MLWRRILSIALLAGVAWGCGTPEEGSVESRAAEPVAATTPAEPSWFTEITAEVGLDFAHQTGGTGDLHHPEIMGSGAALFDYDGDGDLDVYLVNGAYELGEAAATGPNLPVNRLYAWEDGRLTDVTAGSGLGDPGYGMGVAVGDVDNDGRPDVYVANLGRDRLFRNRGGSFEDVTERAGLEVGGWSSSVSFLDIDRDGWLDIYVSRYVTYDRAVKCYDFAGRHDYCGPTAFPGESDVLLHNRGPGAGGAVRFADVSRPAGIAAVAAAGLGVACQDFDGDGWIDVYVTNDAAPNQLWINQQDRGDGPTFRDEALVLGAGVNAMGSAEAGMGVVAADFDNDADLDLFMTHLEDESNTFYRNLGADLGFEDATAASGLAASSMPRTGFGVAAFDAELDGDLDLFVANGRVFRGEILSTSMPPPWNEFAEPNLFYLGDGSGRFAASAVAPAMTAPVEISRGVATGDLDGDGDLDLLLSNEQGPARLYRNDAPRRGHWLLVDAVDPRLNRRALGAVVHVHFAGRLLMRSVTAGFSYQSSSDPRAHFGLGEVAAVDRLVVRWPDGLEEEFPGTPADRALSLVRGEGRAL